MYAQRKKTRQNQSRAVAHSVSQQKGQSKLGIGAQRQLSDTIQGVKAGFAVIQRELDTELEKILLTDGYKEPTNGQYMNWEGGNKSKNDVDWKAHIGVKKEDKVRVIAIVSPILKSWKLNHKFDINDVDVLDKFVTIYPPGDENQWAPVLTQLQDALSGISTIHEKSTEPVMSSGKIGMRHGQINALTHKDIENAGIKLTETKIENDKRGKIIYYTVENKEKVWSGQKGTLAWVSFMGAFFFLEMGTGRPQTAVIWEGLLRSDPRSVWNPFAIPLPAGVETTEKIRTEEERSRLHGNKIRENYYAKLGIFKNL